MVSEPAGRSVRGLLFGSVAECYERYRLDYLASSSTLCCATPDSRCARRSGRRWKSTQLFIAWHRGHRARTRRYGARVGQGDAWAAGEAGRITFEEFRIESRFDLVYAAAPGAGPARLPDRPGPSICSSPAAFSCCSARPAELKETDLFAAVEGVEARAGRRLGRYIRGRSRKWRPPTARRRRTTRPAVRRYDNGREFVGRLAAVSAYLKLSRTSVPGAASVRAILPDQVDIDATVRLSLARRIIIR
jgi:hypothetical protein